MSPQIAIYKTTGELVEVIPHLLASAVIFWVGEMNFTYLMCELGGSSNFEILGDL